MFYCFAGFLDNTHVPLDGLGCIPFSPTANHFSSFTSDWSSTNIILPQSLLDSDIGSLALLPTHRTIFLGGVRSLFQAGSKNIVRVEAGRSRAVHVPVKLWKGL